MKRLAFTLIEMIAVIVVMGLLAAATVLVLAHTAAKERTDALDLEMQQIDAVVRSAARQSGLAQRLTYDLVREQIIWEQPDEEAKSTIMLRLADDDSLLVRTVDQEPGQGRIEIQFSPAGYSPTYAVGLDRKGVPGPWMVVAGISGRVLWMDDEKQIDAIFKTLDSGGRSGSQAAIVPSGLNAH